MLAGGKVPDIGGIGTYARLGRQTRDGDQRLAVRSHRQFGDILLRNLAYGFGCSCIPNANHSLSLVNLNRAAAGKEFLIGVRKALNERRMLQATVADDGDDL